MDGREVVSRHEESGRHFMAGGVDSFVIDAGGGEPVVCLHGVPTSSFLYHKLVVELVARGLRGIAFDQPGLGLAERPTDFDYTWTGLGRFTVAAAGCLAHDPEHVGRGRHLPAPVEHAAIRRARPRTHPRQAGPLRQCPGQRIVPDPGDLGRPGPRAAHHEARRSGPPCRWVPEIIRLPGKHFLQEDQAPAIADHVARFVTG